MSFSHLEGLGSLVLSLSCVAGGAVVEGLGSRSSLSAWAYTSSSRMPLLSQKVKAESKNRIEMAEKEGKDI